MFSLLQANHMVRLHPGLLGATLKHADQKPHDTPSRCSQWDAGSGTGGSENRKNAKLPH